MKRRTILIGLGVFLLLLLLIQFVGFNEGFSEGVRNPPPPPTRPPTKSRGVGQAKKLVNGKLKCSDNTEDCAGMCYKRCDSFNENGKRYRQNQSDCTNCYS